MPVLCKTMRTHTHQYWKQVQHFKKACKFALLSITLSRSRSVSRTHTCICANLYVCHGERRVHKTTPLVNPQSASAKFLVFSRLVYVAMIDGWTAPFFLFFTASSSSSNPLPLLVVVQKRSCTQPWISSRSSSSSSQSSSLWAVLDWGQSLSWSSHGAHSSFVINLTCQLGVLLLLLVRRRRFCQNMISGFARNWMRFATWCCWMGWGREGHGYPMCVVGRVRAFCTWLKEICFGNLADYFKIKRRLNNDICRFLMCVWKKTLTNISPS